MLEKKYALLPADDAVQNWFEENIDKECSASSAIYKFRLWLESLQVKQPGPAWVKANERLPNNPDDPLIHYRLQGRKINGNFYQDNDGMVFFEVRGFTHEPYQIGFKSFQYLEWLDESGTAYNDFCKDNSQLKIWYTALQQEYEQLKSKGDKLALAMRRLARSVQVHPDYLHHQEWKDYIVSGEKALAEWSGEKERMDEWIDVNDRLPKEAGRYWCYVQHLTDIGMSYFQWNCDYNPQLRRFSDMTLTKGEQITHWRPLAAPPIFKQQKEGGSLFR